MIKIKSNPFQFPNVWSIWLGKGMILLEVLIACTTARHDSATTPPIGKYYNQASLLSARGSIGTFRSKGVPPYTAIHTSFRVRLECRKMNRILCAVQIFFQNTDRLKNAVTENKKWWCSVISLTHLGRDKMAAISQTTFSSAFSWMKMFKFRLEFHWRLFLRIQIKKSSIDSDNGLEPTRRQAIIWTNADYFTDAYIGHSAWVS